jgi:hypothetical protein
MRTRTVTVKYWGFMLFAPIFHEEYPGEGLEPIPVPGFGWALDLALEVQQFFNFLLGLFNPEACGFICVLWPLKSPKKVSFKVLY